jgi:two-component system cell cycle response regulator
VETLSKLKSDPLLKDIPVVMLTAEAGKENVIASPVIGVRDYIVKPFKEETLVERSAAIDSSPREAGRRSSIEDPATILIVDDKPAIIQQVQGCGDRFGYPWKIVGPVSAVRRSICRPGSPGRDSGKSFPAGKAAFNFFQMVRANAKTKAIPIFGMCVKTAQEEQAQAQSIGFTGVITKPIDSTELNYRLTKAMNLDTSAKYFRNEDGIQTARLPKNMNELIAAEVAQHIGPKTREMAESGFQDDHRFERGDQAGYDFDQDTSARAAALPGTGNRSGSWDHLSYVSQVL